MTIKSIFCLILESLNKLGVSEADSEESVLKKNFMVYLGIAMSIGGLIWGTMCVILGLSLQAFIPYGYAVLTGFNFIYFHKTKNFYDTRFFQVLISLLVPFFFQFVMGGFYASGGIMLWAVIALIAALTFVSVRHAIYWLIFYLLFTVAIGVLDRYAFKPFVPNARLSELFFIINITIISSIVFGLSYYFINSRQATAERMEAAKKQAEEASKVKSEFLANMSHEIRTPLNGVIGFSELMMNTELNETQRHYMTAVTQSTHSLLDIINDILDFSKIEAGKLELVIEKADLFNIGGQVADMTKFMAHRKGLEMLLNISPQVPRFIWADEIRLRQVLVNLLSNAIKFSEKGEIELKIDLLEVLSENEMIFRFSVRDTGIGIAPANQLKIFEAFSQADNSTTKRFGGTGLGLTISNKLLSLMGSKLQLNSEQGVGSTFYFDLQLQTQWGEPFEWDNLENIRQVLVTDDNEHNRTILRDMLSLKHIRCDEAKNGAEAVEKITSGKKYDALIIDYMMPEMNGIDTIKKIREHLNAEQQPVILLYSSSDDAMINAECEKLQVKQKLVKPIKVNQLFNALSQLKQPVQLKQSDAVKINGIAMPVKRTRQVKILVAEDHKINLALCKIFIKEIIPDAVVIEAANGLQAVEKFEQEKPAIVFMDIQMPEMDGYEACAEIRKSETDAPVPIIALTAGTVKGEKEKCMSYGMNDYISKPFAKDTMRRVIEEWIKN